MKIKHFASTFVLLFVMNLCFSQLLLEGYLTDAESGEPVGFANITIKNKIGGTAANVDGYFRINETSYTRNDTLMITHIEYITLSIPANDLLSGTRKLRLRKNTIILQAVDVVAREDDQTLDAIVAATKTSLKFPMTQKVYYRETVRENKGYNKFADGLLTVVYPESKDDLQIKVDQCRAKDLPKDSDDLLEMMTILKLDFVLGLQYTNFLDRFRGENRKDYHFYRMETPASEGTLLKIEPKKEADRSDNKILFYATIKADQNMNLQEAVLRMDSLCNLERSLLGFHIRIPDIRMTVDFSTFHERVYLSHARCTMLLNITRKDKTQRVDFTSELLTSAVAPAANAIERKDRFKKSVLYKFGNKYDHDFWKTVNMPAFTPEEEKLLKDLESK
jgi:hypothetical protein